MYENTNSVGKFNSVLISIFIILSLLNTVMVVSAAVGETISSGSEEFTVTDGTLTDSDTVILTLDDTEYFNLAGNATILWESTIASTVSLGRNIGDVTGDSISDILFADAYNSALTLYSGADGSEIWTSTINVIPNPNYIYLDDTGDFDGDGVNDILVSVIDYNYSTTYTKTDYNIAIKGTDGSQLWQKQESSSSDFYIQMYSIGDINGDAKDDIAYEYDCDSHFNLSIIDGGSGSTIWTHTESLSSESSDWAYADSSAGDLDRDGISDFFMYRYDSVYDSTNYTYDYNSQLTAISGKTGFLIWNMSSEYLNYDSISDIDGDGYNDVVISTYDQTLIVRGYDAYQLRTVDGDFVGTIDDVNGNGFDDIVVSDYENLIALDVNTGNTIWTKPISTDTYFYYAFSLGDENGDGVNDLIALSYRDDQNTLYDIYTGVSGSNGGILWNKEFEYIYEYNSSTGSEYSKYSYLDTIENLDQGGKQCIVIYEYSQYCESWDSDYQVFNNWTAIRGSDGEVLWNLDKSGFGSYWPIYIDFNNDGVFDVLDYGSDMSSSSSFTATESAVKSVSSLSTLSASLSQNDYQLPGQNQRYPNTFLSNIELNRPKFSSTDARGSVSISAMQSSIAPSSLSEVSSEESILSYARMFSGDSIDNIIWRVDSDTKIIPIIYGWGYYGYYNYNPNDLNSDGASDVVLWNGDNLYALTDGHTSSDNVAPIANSQNKVTNENASVDITLSATDTDGDSLTYIIVDGPTNGTVSLSGTINIATYTPNANFSGTDSFTFKVNDGTVDSNTATVSIIVIAVNDLPVADSNGPYTGTEGTEITFDGSGSSDPDGEINSYDWDFGDGNSETGVTPTHAYGQDGTYTVTLTVTDDGGATDSDSTTAVVGNIAPTVTILSPPAITNDSTPLLHATFDQMAAYVWYTIDGAVGTGESNADNLTVILPEREDGQHTVKVYANNSDGNVGFATKDFLVDTIAPVVTIDQVISLTNDSIQIINGTFAEDGSEIESIIVNGEPAVISDNAYSAEVSLNEGSNAITVIATDNAGNVGEAEDEIVLDTTAPTVDSVTLNNTVVQSNASIEVNVSATDANEIVIVTADGFALTLTSDYYIGIIIAGESPVIVNVTDEAGNMATDDSATYIIDDDKPVVNISDPQQNDSIRFVDNIVKGNVTDANFASAHLIVRNETNVIVGLQYDLIIEEDGSFIEWVEYANDQNNTLELCAFDQAGNFNDICMVDNISVLNNAVHTEVEVEQNIEKIINATDEADAELLINANINTTINVTITAITDVTRLDNLSDSSALRAFGNIVEIHVDGINASNASEVNYVTVRMYYTIDDLDLDGDGTIEVGELNEDDLFIYWYDSDNTTWIKLEIGNLSWVNSVGRVDTGDYSGYVWAKIHHLSTFGLAAGSVPVPIDDDDNDDDKPPSSGGSSGGGGGSSGEAYGNIAVKEVIRNYVSVETTNTYQFKGDANAIGFVTFDAKTNAGYIAATVEVLKDTSTLVSAAPSGKVYQNMNIWVGTSGYATENNIANPVIGFKVAKSWITENDIDESTVKLNRYSSGVWDQLPTTKTDEDGSYIYFSSETLGFSPFAITGDERSSTAVADTQDPLFSPPSSIADDDVGEPVGETASVPYDEAKSSSGLVLVIGLIVISVIVVGVYLRKNKK